MADHSIFFCASPEKFSDSPAIKLPRNPFFEEDASDGFFNSHWVVCSLFFIDNLRSNMYFSKPLFLGKTADGAIDLSLMVASAHMQRQRSLPEPLFDRFAEIAARTHFQLYLRLAHGFSELV
ncbi:MAG: hypothetical protein DSY90_12900 [Deltaproteobacteria bacterium]|nr:MAG: hypothetical protein DSY90_12900 [Deltaproteobacteria bacterium]